MSDSDLTYSLVETIVIDLDAWFVIEEDTTYRDEYPFSDVDLVLCEELSFKLCTDELCTAVYTSSWDIQLKDLNDDGRINQLAVST